MQAMDLWPTVAPEPFKLEHLPAHQAAALHGLLERHRDAFGWDSSDLGCCTVTVHEIHTGNAAPHRRQPRRYSPAEKVEFARHVGIMSEARVVEPSISAWRHMPVLAPKKDGDTRFCINYHPLNDKTEKDAYLPPRIEDIFDNVGRSCYFSLLDARAGYWQILLAERDRPKTAFWTPDGLYHYLRMPFGLCTAPATFQRAMDQVFRGSAISGAFMDDILVHSSSFEEPCSTWMMPSRASRRQTSSCIPTSAPSSSRASLSWGTSSPQRALSRTLVRWRRLSRCLSPTMSPR